MLSGRPGWRLIVLVALLVVIHPVFGEDFPQPQETLPGFKAHSVFESRGVENLSLFNGDPQLAIPLGPEYSLGAGVSFQLRAYYSSRFWHMYQTPCGQDEHGQPILRGRAHVRGFSTLGVGWTLELGSIDPAPHANALARYYSPDGSVHEFVPPADGVLSVPQDDAEIRIQHVPTGGYVVRFPDGTSHWLTHQYKRPAPVNGFDFSDVDHHPLYPRKDRWGLEKVSDRFGREAMRVTWTAEDPSPDAWKVASIFLLGSSQSISFHWGTHTPANQSLAWPVLTSIDFPIQKSPSITLEATFGYSASGRFRRTAFDDFPVECDETGPRLFDLPFLETITQSTLRYGFEYSIGDSGTGLLSAYRLPTGARVSFEYENATALAPCLWGSYPACSTFDEIGTPQSTSAGTTDPADRKARIDAFIDNAPGVVSRTEFDPTTGTTATTEYRRKQFAQAVDPPPPVGPLRDPYRLVRRVIVRSPSGDGSGILATRHLFHVLVKGTDGPSSAWVDSVSTGPGVEVERRIYAGDIAAGDPVRSVVQCYDDVFSGTPVTSCGALDTAERITKFTEGTSFKRLSRTTTWYGTNPADGAADCIGPASTSIACHVRGMTNWDADAMEYGQETILAPRGGPSAVFLQPGQTGRLTSTTWDSSIFASSNPELSYWHPKRFTSHTVEDLNDEGCPNEPCVTTVEALFAESTGAALSKKEGSGTLTRTTTWEYDASHDPTTETVSGVGFVGQSLLTTRTFQNGLVTSSVRGGVSPDGGWAQFHVTRDPALGLISTSYDPNGPETTYAYDPLGRLARITPPGEAPTTFAYKDWTSSQPSQGALVVVKRKPVGSDDSTDDGVPLAGSGSVEAYEYDGFGRVRRQIRRLPNRLPPYADGTPIGSYFAVQFTRRNAAGLIAFVSEWVPCNVVSTPTDFTGCISTTPTAGTSFTDFDAFGRPLTTLGPDGTVTTRSYDDWSSSPSVARDTDTSEETTNQKPNLGSVTSAIRKDLFGRVLNVAEPVATPTSGDADFAQVTSYRYNVFDKVTAVHLLADPSEQVRTFAYNQLGFLVSELTPEKGTGLGSGATTYSTWDLLGNARAKNVAGMDYSYVFDTLGRLTAASTGTAPNLVSYVEQKWDEDAPAYTNYGRLTRRIGANGSLPTVTERFGYFPDTGRLASKTTEFGTGLLGSVTEGWQHDDLGHVVAHAHPRVTGLFSVMTAFVSGYPTVVKANGLPVVLNATYGPSGSLWTYTTGNGTNAGVTTTIGIDETSWMSRPASLHSLGPSGVVFSEPKYTYDGLGNIRSIGPSTGPDSFEYDARSRLVSATFGDVTRTYDYDDFGNRLNLGATGLSVDQAKNQIAGDTLGRVYAYDSRGNQTQMGGEEYGWDNADRMISYRKDGALWKFAYTGENERILKVPPVGLTWGQYAFRDPGARLATEFAGDGTAVKPTGDYMFLGGQLVATYQSCSSGSGRGWQYIVTDHLGTPRVGTNAASQVVWQKKYWPFGEELVLQPTGAGSVAFAGMEADAEVGGPVKDTERYYDHARTHSGDLGRFLSPDVLGGRLDSPDTWNKYAYARNNPLKYVDPDGRANDWAYGPFSDNNPKTPIRWNSVTPQQKAVEGTLAAITTVAAVGPLVAVALPVVGLDGLGMALANMSIGAAVGAASNENDPKNGASVGALTGLVTAGGGPASSATRGALASFLSQKVVGDDVNYAKVAWSGVIAGQASWFVGAMKSAGVAMSGTAAQVWQSAMTEMGLWMTGVDAGPYAPAKVEKKTPSDCPAAGSECKK